MIPTGQPRQWNEQLAKRNPGGRFSTVDQPGMKPAAKPPGGVGLPVLPGKGKTASKPTPKQPVAAGRPAPPFGAQTASPKAPLSPEQAQLAQLAQQAKIAVMNAQRVIDAWRAKKGLPPATPPPTAVQPAGPVSPQWGPPWFKPGMPAAAAPAPAPTEEPTAPTLPAKGAVPAGSRPRGKERPVAQPAPVEKGQLSDKGKQVFSGVLAKMTPDERQAFDTAYQKAMERGLSPEEFLVETYAKYKTEAEDESTAETWLSGHTMTALDRVFKVGAGRIPPKQVPPDKAAPEEPGPLTPAEGQPPEEQQELPFQQQPKGKATTPPPVAEEPEPVPVRQPEPAEGAAQPGEQPTDVPPELRPAVEKQTAAIPPAPKKPLPAFLQRKKRGPRRIEAMLVESAILHLGRDYSSGRWSPEDIGIPRNERDKPAPKLPPRGEPKPSPRDKFHEVYSAKAAHERAKKAAQQIVDEKKRVEARMAKYGDSPLEEHLRKLDQQKMAALDHLAEKIGVHVTGPQDAAVRSALNELLARSDAKVRGLFAQEPVPPARPAAARAQAAEAIASAQAATSQTAGQAQAAGAIAACFVPERFFDLVADWEEEDHPRDTGGRFADKGGGRATVAPPRADDFRRGPAKVGQAPQIRKVKATQPKVVTPKEVVGKTFDFRKIRTAPPYEYNVVRVDERGVYVKPTDAHERTDPDMLAPEIFAKYFRAGDVPEVRPRTRSRNLSVPTPEMWSANSDAAAVLAGEYFALAAEWDEVQHPRGDTPWRPDAKN